MARIISPASNQNRTLAFVGNGFFDLYMDSNKMLWSVPKDSNSGATETLFGDRNHILALKRKGNFSGFKATAVGQMMLDQSDTLFMTRQPNRQRAFMQ